jgi:hypothetical protein
LGDMGRISPQESDKTDKKDDRTRHRAAQKRCGRG